MALNVLTAAIGSGCQRATAIPSAVQWDRGQILQVTGVELPFAYNVEFCCQGDTTTVTMIGDASGVEIPNSLLERGLPIIAYIVLHEGEDDRETEYWITVNVKARPQPTNVSPDPGQQDAIDQLIAELDAGVQAAEDAAEAAETAQGKAEDAQEAAEAAVEHYPKIVDGYWYVWQNGEWVNTGVKAEGSDGREIVSVSCEKTGTSGLVDTYTMTITYNSGNPDTVQFLVTNGADGYSPVVTITEISGGHRVTITDKTHPVGQSFDVTDGTNGVSPEVTITEITGGHRVTITDEDHPLGQSFDVMDGEDAVIDATLSHAGEAADAKATGDALSQLNSEISETCTDATGLQLVDEEKLNTIYTDAFLNTLDRIFTELPQDDSLEDIYDEIVTEVSLLDQLYREVAAAVNA